MSARSFVLLFVLTAISAEFHLTSASLDWVKYPATEITQTYPNQKTLTLKWEWKLSGGQKVNGVEIKRYKKNDKDVTEKNVGVLYSDGTLTSDNAYFNLSGQKGVSGGSNGYIELTINDVNNQGNNEDNSKVDVMVSDYTYVCDVAIIAVNKPYSKSTKLIVYVLPGTPVLQLHPYKPVFCQGDTINITCNGVTGHPTLTNLAFLQNDSSIGMLNVTTSGNYTKTVLSHALTQPGTLTFSCKATNAGGSSSSSNNVTITVKDPPVITNCKNETVLEKDKLVWTCDVSGSQPLNISWFKGINNNTVFQSSGKNLSIAAVNRTDHGMYRFTASNGGECPTASKTVYLDVQFPPSKPVLQMDPNRLMFCRNDTINVTCTAEAGDPPETNWTIWQNNAIIGLRAYRTNAVVSRNLTKAGTVSFSCQATNLVGSSPISAVNITVKDPPVITSCKNMEVVENEKLVWTCNVSGSQPLTISWFKGTTNTVLQSGNSLNIAAVNRTDSGMYRFTASNGEGCSNANATVYLDVQFPPSKPVLQIDPNRLMFCSNDTINVTCTAQAGDPPETNLTIWQNTASIGLIANGTNAALTRKLTKAGTVSFSCQATNLVGSSPISAVNITVKDPPVISNCTGKIVVEKKSLHWTCDVSGSQPLNISWFKGNNNTVFQSGKSLNITTVLRADAGMYRFTASNGEGCPTASTTVNLDVQFPPSKPVLQIDPNRLMYCSNDTINVTCTAQAGDPPETNLTIWQNTASIGLITNRTNAVLTQKLTKTGTDSFSCQATNLVGSSPISVVNITVKDPPVISNCTDEKVVENKNLVWTCDVSGSQPLNISWFKGNNNTVIQSGKSLNIASVSRADFGKYRFTASNGEGCPTASTTVNLDVQYLEDCSKTAFEFTNGDSISEEFRGSPVPTLNCSSNSTSVKQNGSHFEIRSSKSSGVSTCTLGNSVGSCSFKVIVHQREKATTKESRCRCRSCKWSQALGDSKTEDFTRYKKKWENILKRIYRNKKYVTKITVLGFWPGSVIVNFALTLIANVSDPLSPLKEELSRNNGSVDGFAIDPNSIQSGPYVPPTTTGKPIITTTNTPKPITTSTPFPESAIIGIVVGCALLLILVILLVYCCYCKKRRDSKNEEHKRVEEGGNGVPLTERGIDNKGSSPSPSTYAKHGPGANGNNNAGNGDVNAQVDKSKETKNPAEEVVYADLSHVRGDNKSGDTQLAHMPSSGNQPAKHESDYAEITGVIRPSEKPEKNESADNSNKNEKNPENAEKESKAEEQAKDKNQDGSTSTSQTVDNAVKNDNASGSQINVETKGTSSSATQYGKESEETFTKL